MPKGLLHRSCPRALLESLHRDLFKRSCQETSCRDLVQRSCQESSVKDPVRRLGEENRDLAQRSLTEIFCGDLLQTPCADSLIKGSCTVASTENLSRRSCTRSSAVISSKTDHFFGFWDDFVGLSQDSKPSNSRQICFLGPFIWQCQSSASGHTCG